MANFLNIDNLNIEFESQGSGNDLLYIHGGSVSYRSSYMLVGELSRNFKVWTFSLPGAGKSSKFPNDWVFDDYPSLIIDLCEKLAINPILAGHSLGGAITLKTLAEYPDRFKYASVFAPAGVPENKPSKTVGEVIYGGVRSIVGRNNVYRCDTLINLLYHSTDFNKLSKIFSSVDLRSDLPLIKAKVIIFGGLDDEVLSAKPWKYFKKNIKNSKLFLFKSGHQLPAKNYKEIAEIIVKEILKANPQEM